MSKKKYTKSDLSKKRKEMLLALLNRNDVLALLSSSACEDDAKLFKEDYGFTMKNAHKAIDALLEFLKK